MTTPIVTRVTLQEMLNRPNRAFVAAVIGRALVAIFRRQTEAEQATASTVEENGIGFAGCDARTGSLTAKYFIKHGTLLDWQIDAWTKVGKNGYSRLCKYHTQLNEVARVRTPAK